MRQSGSSLFAAARRSLLATLGEIGAMTDWLLSRLWPKPPRYSRWLAYALVALLLFRAPLLLLSAWLYQHWLLWQAAQPSASKLPSAHPGGAGGVWRVD